MNNEETVPYWSCGLCGKPVAPFAGAVWLSDDVLLCPKCGKKHRESKETLPTVDRGPGFPEDEG